MFNQVTLLTQSLWRDEAFSVLLSIRPLREIAVITARDYSPPFYYFILHFWIGLFGWSEPALRLLSILFTILACVVIYFLGKKMFSNQVGLVSAVLLFLVPPVFYYSFEVRMYTLFIFLAVLSFYFLISEKWLLFILTSLAGLYTHNFMLFSLGGEILAYLAWKDWKLPKKNFVLSCLALGLGYFPWLGVLISQFTSVQRSFWLNRPSWGWLFLAISGLFFLSIVFLKTKNPSEKALALWGILPFSFTVFISYFVPLFHLRYFLFAFPPLICLLCSFLLSLQWNKVLSSTLVILFLCVNLNIWFKPDKSDIRTRLEPLLKSGSREQVVCASILNYFETKYYLLRFSPQMVENLYLLESGWVHHAGGSLVDQSKLLHDLPEEGFLVEESGGIKKLETGNYRLDSE
ncbi:MAG: glycosyltransferase family 39 protein [Patescibacteria group bacterium]